MKNILVASSEVFPFIKTGGLADVAGSLPKYIDKNEFDVRVVLPKYACMNETYKHDLHYITSFHMELGWRQQYVGVLEYELDGIHYYFIDNEFYFSGERPYTDIGLDMEKFAFFCRAVLSILPVIGFRPDLIHCNDWQTSLIPVYLKDSFAQDPFFTGIKTIYSIHNIRFQGLWSLKETQEATGLSDYYFTPDKMEHYGAANLMKGGLCYTDFITTVSKTYACEIQTPYYGERLDPLIRARADHVIGIVNGLDYEVYDPQNDPLISQKFSAETLDEGKTANKLALQERMGLNKDPDVMLIGLVSRLTDQKGIDLIDCIFGDLMSDAVQFVILGTGEEHYEEMFRYFASRYPGKVSANITYCEELSHMVYAGCDAFLMPSAFEPCGLSQLMSLRYGTLPIVRETGGLKDTVKAYNEYEQTGTGFSFANYNAHEMLDTIRYAQRVYYDTPDAWKAMRKRAMEEDFSWSRSAKEYEDLYTKVIAE